MSRGLERRAFIVAALARSVPGRIMEVPLDAPGAARIDLSTANPVVAATDCRDSAAVMRLVAGLIEAGGAHIGVGGYGENRGWYARGEQFTSGDEVRSIHLGVDIWAPAAARVFAPYAGVIESFKDNALVGDYGPTVILRHELEGEIFFTLYGHLSRESLIDKRVGASVEQGAPIGTLGAPPFNGDWPPHLHFQVILDLLGLVGDYPGVAALRDRERFLALCPDPNLIVRSPLLCAAETDLLSAHR
jgi:murein DD-endopeptidase MepM/ murein hydrolase activator NlpD